MLRCLLAQVSRGPLLRQPRFLSPGLQKANAVACYSTSSHEASSKFALHAVAAAATAGATAAAMARYKNGVSADSDDMSHQLYADEQRNVALFEKCSVSVVHINTLIEKQVIVPGRRGYHLDLQEIPQGQGSGFFWDAQHVVTNYHVIKDADKAVIVLSDNTHCEAALVGIDPDHDLAVLKLFKGKAPQKQLERGRSSNLMVGQRVYAIGNPFGLDQTLTSGIVSGLGREVKGVKGNMIRGVIQTDAAINPGNSGGPLLDARGRLIGVNTMIASPSGAFAGVGFAIPVDMVVSVVQQLIQYGRMRHAYLGVTCAPDHVAKQISPDVGGGNRGVFVLNIEPGSPADKAGLQPTMQTRFGIRLGDEILKLGEKVVTSAEGLFDAVTGHNIGDEVELLIRRRGEQGSARTFINTVKLVERPKRFERDVSNSGGGQFVQDDGQRPRPWP